MNKSLAHNNKSLKHGEPKDGALKMLKSLIIAAEPRDHGTPFGCRGPGELDKAKSRTNYFPSCREQAHALFEAIKRVDVDSLVFKARHGHSPAALFGSRSVPGVLR